MATAKKAGKVAGKAAGELAKGAGEGVKMAGKVAKAYGYKMATEHQQSWIAAFDKVREGHMAHYGPNKAAYDAKQRLLKKTKAKMNKESVQDDMRISQNIKQLLKKARENKKPDTKSAEEEICT